MTKFYCDCLDAYADFAPEFLRKFLGLHIDQMIWLKENNVRYKFGPRMIGNYVVPITQRYIIIFDESEAMLFRIKFEAKICND